MESHSEEDLNKLTDSVYENCTTQLCQTTESEFDSSAKYSPVKDSEDSIKQMKPNLKLPQQTVSPPEAIVKDCLVCANVEGNNVCLMKRDLENLRTCRLFLLVGMRKPLCSFCREALYRCANSLRLQITKPFPRDVWRRRHITFCLLCGSHFLLKKMKMGILKKFVLRQLIHKTVDVSDVEDICRHCSVIITDLEYFYAREMIIHLNLRKRLPKVLSNDSSLPASD